MSWVCRGDRRQLGHLAILFGEPDRESFLHARAHGAPRISAVNYVEAAVRVDMGGNPIASDAFDDLLREAAISVEPLTIKQAHLALHAQRTYGRGSDSPARLNFGDCFIYALAEDTREPLLFKSNDFFHTDVEAALATLAAVGVA